MYHHYVKRQLDIVFSAFFLVILSPLFVGVYIGVKRKLGAPVLFQQQRPGLDGKPFTMYKFRTMRDAMDGSGRQLPDDERLTSFGQALRASSLDELPELFNILKGDMSFVGPRPLLTDYLPLYSDRQRRRHEVRPGLTGLAQVKGRNAISWEKKFEWDVAYVENVTFLGDCRILFSTFSKVVKREGIHSETSATMEVFRGNQRRRER
ncbi:sugar transferase [Halobacillus fulvus]|nr:sugar transferase [Halobacillus fulvus]